MYMNVYMAQEVLDRHYRHLAERYDDFLYYSPDFVRIITSKMIEMLELRETDTLVDLGCGTAIYSLDILKQVPLRDEVIAVDPYPEMIAQISPDAKLRLVEADALDFSKRPDAYDKVLIKEAIHHIHERRELFANLFERLREDGILLLVHVPPEVEYPLFKKALERCKQWHADPNELTRQLANVGFRVERDTLRYTHSIPKYKYFEMVRNCYMSALTSLDEREIEEGLKEMDEKYRDREVFRFADHFDYLKAIK